jgi:hypothetical protein
VDPNNLYLVVVKLRGWEFMAEASHINAKKAVRALPEDLQKFYDESKRNSMAQLMQQGAAAVGVAAIEDTRRPELKRKAEFDELEIQERRQKLQERQLNMPLEIEERQLSLQLQPVDGFMERLSHLKPEWRADAWLQQQAEGLLCTAFSLQPRPAAPESAAAP